MKKPETNKVDEQDRYWGKVWEKAPPSTRLLEREKRSKRFALIQKFICAELGKVDSTRIAEVGSGLGYNSLLLAQEGANITLIDTEIAALRKAQDFFGQFNRKPNLICGDLFRLQDVLSGRFDVVMSFGFAEHFQGLQRKEVLDAHMCLAKPGGIVIISVPHRYSPLYRVQKATIDLLRKWKTGYRYFSRSGTNDAAPEYPFSRREFALLTDGPFYTFRKTHGVAFLEPLDDYLKILRYSLEKLHIYSFSKYLTLPDLPVPLLDDAYGKHLVFLARKNEEVIDS